MGEKPKKKLLVIASTFPRWKDDTEPRFVLDLSIHMLDEFEVTVLAPAAPRAKPQEVLEGVKVIRYRYFPVHKWETLCYPGAIVPRIKEKKARALLVPFLFLALYVNLFFRLPEYDIVHAHWIIPQGIVQSFFKKPYVITGHGGDVTSLNKGIIKKMKIRCLRKATHVTVVSEHLSNKLQELVPKLQPSIIPMGVDITKFGSQYGRKDYFGQGNKKVVLFVGRLAEKKGVTYLIDAMKQVDALCVIVGNGPLKDKLVKQAAEVKDKIVFLGTKTHKELQIIYPSADIFIAPSVTASDGDQEGVPTTIMEAMASGLPVVASESGGISYLVRDGINGLLCEERNVQQLADNINCLLNDKQLYQGIVENAQNIIKEYDYRVLAKKYKDILNR